MHELHTAIDFQGPISANLHRAADCSEYILGRVTLGFVGSLILRVFLLHGQGEAWNLEKLGRTLDTGSAASTTVYMTMEFRKLFFCNRNTNSFCVVFQSRLKVFSNRFLALFYLITTANESTAEVQSGRICVDACEVY